jgi:hypothetical protein
MEGEDALIWRIGLVHCQPDVFAHPALYRLLEAKIGE